MVGRRRRYSQIVRAEFGLKSLAEGGLRPDGVVREDVKPDAWAWFLVVLSWCFGGALWTFKYEGLPQLSPRTARILISYLIVANWLELIRQVWRRFFELLFVRLWPDPGAWSMIVRQTYVFLLR